MSRRLIALAYTSILALLIVSLAFGGEVRKLGSNDLEWGYGTTTSPAGKVVTKIPRYYDNNAFADNTTLYGVDLITKGPWMDVRAYGAKCDNATDDSVALAAAFAAATDGDTIYFPDGICPFSTAITKDAASITLLGTGRASVLKWTGADGATMITIGTEEYGGTALTNKRVTVANLEFELNDKATCGLSVGSGKNLRIQGVSFVNGKHNGQSPALGMLNIGTANYGGVVQNSWFFGGNTHGITLNRNGYSSGPVNMRLSDLVVGQIDNTFMSGKNIDHLTAEHITIESSYGTYTNSAGFYLDQVSTFKAYDIYSEQIPKTLFNINPENAPTTTVISGEINRLTCILCGYAGTDNIISLGYTDSMKLSDISLRSTVSGTYPVHISGNASRTRIGKILYDSETATPLPGIMDNGVNTIYGLVFVPHTSSDTSILSLTNQSDVPWTQSDNVSVTLTSVPKTAKAWTFWASIKSATAGAKLYLVREGDSGEWSARDTNKQVQWIQANDNTYSTYNTGTFIIQADNVNTAIDSFVYGIGGAGTSDTDVEIRLIGWWESP